MVFKVKNKVVVSLSLLVMLFVIIFFIPFTSINHIAIKGEQYCRYRFAVYEFSFIESEGEGEIKSDVIFYNIRLGKKIGGPLEYFRLRKIGEYAND